MIGVPESLRELTFTITTNDMDSKKMSITTPIPIDEYFLNQQKQIVQEL